MTDTAYPKIATQYTDMDLHLQALPQRQTEAYRVWRLVQIVIKKHKSSRTNSKKKRKKKRPEQLVAFLICVGLQLHNRLILLDELEELRGVELGITIVIGLQKHG